MADLTTLAAVKAFLSINTTGSDAIIATLISRESAYVEQWTSRRFPSVTRTAKRLNGTGTRMLTLPDSPIISVESLTVCNAAVTASDGQSVGYVFDDTTLHLVGGGSFPMGKQNVVASWTAGYRESETDFIPAGNTPTLTPTTGGTAATPVSVTDGNGVVFSQVGNGPVAHQFSFANGTFTFNASNSGASVTMVYDYVPGPVEQACIEMVGLDLRQRDNLGITQKQMANEFVAYSDKSMTRSVQEMLQPFRRLAPV